MAAARVRVSSRALGPRVYVTVYLYDSLAQMQIAAHRYNGGAFEEDVCGVTQVSQDRAYRDVSVIVRLSRTHLGTRVVSHEMHHAATALYGAHIPGERIDRRRFLRHSNEPFAYLFSDLYCSLTTRLYALGFYD